MDSGATAVLVFNDLVAIGPPPPRRARDQVPGDIADTGFEDIPFFRYNVPSLTTAAVPYEVLGSESCHRLRALVRGEEPDYGIIYQPRLVHRGSTGPAMRPRNE